MSEPISTKILLKDVRFSYAHVFEPSSITAGGPLKYSVALLIPKEGKNADRNKEAIDNVINHLSALVKAEPANKGKLPKKFEICLKDGDLEDKGDDYLGHWFINAKSDVKPGVVGRELDENGKPKPIGPDEFKSGDYGHVTVNLFKYDTAGNCGIGCGLNNIMKTRDGESLAGRASAASDFADVLNEEDDELGIGSSKEDDFM